MHTVYVYPAIRYFVRQTKIFHRPIQRRNIGETRENDPIKINRHSTPFQLCVVTQIVKQAFAGIINERSIYNFVKYYAPLKCSVTETEHR
jgi:hypothetical protein